MMAGPRTRELHDLGARPRPRPGPRRWSASSTVPVDAGLERLQQQAVALEQRVELAGVDPPAVEDLVADPVAVVDEPLDGVGDLQLAAGRRLDGAHGLVDGGGRTGRRRPGPGRTAGRRASRPGARRRRRRRARPRRTAAGRAPGSAGSGPTAGRGAVERRCGARPVGLEAVDELGEALLAAGCRRGTSRSRRRPGSRRAMSTQWARPERRVLGDVGDLERPTATPSPTAAIDLVARCRRR